MNLYVKYPNFFFSIGKEGKVFGSNCLEALRGRPRGRSLAESMTGAAEESLIDAAGGPKLP